MWNSLCYIKQKNKTNKVDPEACIFRPGIQTDNNVISGQWEHFFYVNHFVQFDFDGF